MSGQLFVDSFGSRSDNDNKNDNNDYENSEKVSV